MCSKPDPFEVYRDLNTLMTLLSVDSGEFPQPAHDYAWSGARTYYGLLENA